MFYNISLIVGIVLNFIAIMSNILICFVNDENKWNGQMKIISTQCRWIGLVYIALAYLKFADQTTMDIPLLKGGLYLKGTLSDVPSGNFDIFIEEN